MADSDSKEYFRERNQGANQQAHRRKWNQKNPHVMRQIASDHREKHPTHIAARENARQDKGPHKCARCGKPATAAHHTSYNPPKHEWLCKEHHDGAHRTRPNVRRTLSKAKRAGLIKKKFAGLDVTIETPKGTWRQWGPEAHQKTLMRYDYGFIQGAKGADGDEYDCFLGPDETVPFAFIVHQKLPGDEGPGGLWDEDKVMLGFDGPTEALEAYLKHYDDPRFAGSLSQMTIEDFKETVMTQTDGMVKSLGDRLSEFALSKSHALEWCSQFQGTPLYSGALSIEKEYLEACRALEVTHVAAAKQRQAAEREMTRALDKQHPYYDKYEKMHDLGEKTNVKKKALELKLLELRQKEVSGMAKSGGHKDGPHLTAPKGYPKGRKEYGDPEGFRYPLDNEGHVRAALSYFSKPTNAAKYPSAKRAQVWGRIKAAARKHGIEVSGEAGPPSLSKSQSRFTIKK